MSLHQLVTTLSTDSFERMLASRGAFSFAQRNNIQTVSEDELVTPRATQAWKTWKWRIEHRQEAEMPDHKVNDTVGAVVLDSEGRLAAGVSRSVKAGLLRTLVHEISASPQWRDFAQATRAYRRGKVQIVIFIASFSSSFRQAAMYGAGCWAWSPSKTCGGVATSTSGNSLND